MPDRTPLSTLLAQVFVAFTIELDNEAEVRLAATRARLYPVSVAMWHHLMRFVGTDGVRVRDIPVLAGVPGTPVTSGWIHTMCSGMTRWGYVEIAPDPADARTKPPRADWVVTATPAGREAQAVWAPLGNEIDARWEARFGRAEIDALRSSLAAVLEQVDVVLPRSLPILGFGMTAVVPQLQGAGEVAAAKDDAPIDLAVLLARVLLLLTVEFERDARVSLAIAADVLRVIDDPGTRVRDLPARAGVSKEAISAAFTFLQQHRFLALEPDPAGRGKIAVLTPSGRKVRAAAERRLAGTEAEMGDRFGAGAIDRLRDALGTVLAAPRFAEGLVPPPTGWRARRPYAAQSERWVRDPRGSLPHYPMILHRGGWPDGA